MGNIGEIQEEIERWVSPSPALVLPPSTGTTSMPLALNHISFVCKSVAESVEFYYDVLGFVLIKRPSSFNFEGAWLFNYGIGIHLLESDKTPAKKSKINPKDNHISFQCSDMNLVIKKLEEKNIEYVTAVVEEGGITVDQLFFHDPDGHMVEICNCQNLPVLPLSACPIKLPKTNGKLTSSVPSLCGKQSWELQCLAEVASLMMDNLVVNMMDFSI
ncbi:metallothiol transferase FosB-like isoform X2 [Populus alba x Populus x berolinensis]|uniref:Metallothiol transferase FosB-like isoform X2 n=1 Tax=Populus alba x Populus x berolinensis TaxID=444605 RepID=A0AAD6R4D1_9ROSI|nr:metallothiol transferase FosB-like isoform X2 [Populus alba]KAJ6937787.1 metallothiol transferase FosB-like isoform X2 [Populus alba x Populus x berolinensis]KAJ7002116.1 metallothiol transferase FosB-like isoform X2 [Populus alba x Populus x berolinensis]